MDGPYFIKLLAQGMGYIDMKFIHSQRDKDVVMFSVKTDIRPCLENAASVAEQVLSAYRKQNWKDRDGSAIRRSLTDIRKFLIRNTM